MNNLSRFLLGRKKKDDEVSVLEKKVRELKALNRSLLKRLKKVNKGYRKIRDEDETETSDEKDENPSSTRCTHCERGNVKLVHVLNRSWMECDVCEYRTKTEITE